MKWVVEGDRLIGLELTRRNLETLLAKLDRNARRHETGEEESAVIITKTVDFNGATEVAVPIVRVYYDTLYVHGVENDAHYADRPAGGMHPADEPAISRPPTGVE
jgi:hypothetical protein